MGWHRKSRNCVDGGACHPTGRQQQQQTGGENSKLTMSVVLEVDLSCCGGCRDWICKNLKLLDGVEEVKVVGEDKTRLIVTGERLDAAEILRKVKGRKTRVEVLEVQVPLPRRDEEAACDPPPLPASREKIIPLPCDPPPKPKHRPPPPNTTTARRPSRKCALQRGDTLVTERLHEEIQGTKIRTRVTTTHDACTCVRFEETRFIIDKCAVSHHQPHRSTTHILQLLPALNISTCQHC